MQSSECLKREPSVNSDVQVCTVFAQLTVNGKWEGPHVFVVRIRDDDGGPISGVRIEDNGAKVCDFQPGHVHGPCDSISSSICRWQRSCSASCNLHERKLVDPPLNSCMLFMWACQTLNMPAQHYLSSHTASFADGVEWCRQR